MEYAVTYIMFEQFTFPNDTFAARVGGIFIHGN